MFEVLDGMMLKDGYLYKKVSIDSLSFWGVVPTADELLKFEPANKDESTDEQWLTQLFGEKKKKEVKHSMKSGKGGGKSEGSSSADPENNFELHDLVFIGYISVQYPLIIRIQVSTSAPLTCFAMNCFGSRKDFGVVIGSDKDDTVKVSALHYSLFLSQDFSFPFSYSLDVYRRLVSWDLPFLCFLMALSPFTLQVIKEGSEGPTVVNVKPSELKIASFDRKLFTVSDHRSNTLRANDEVRVLDGPLKV